MKSIVRLAVASALCTTLVGCKLSDGIPAEAIIAEAVIAKNHQLDTIVTSALNYEQTEEVRVAFQNYEKFKAKWLDRPNLDIIITDDFILDYRLLKDDYFKVEGIVMYNWDSYDAYTQRKLVLLRREFVKVDAAMQKAINERNKYEAYYVAGKVIYSLIKLFAKV